jgi:alpha-mannosidase
VLKHPSYTRDRLRQTVARLDELVYPERRPAAQLLISPCVDRISWDQAQELPYEPVALGQEMGPLWATYWIRAEFEVPPEWTGARVDLLWESHSEATLWLDGRSAQGLNSRPGLAGAPFGSGARTEAVLSAAARGSERLSAQLEVACNGEFGAPASPYRTASGVRLDRCEIARFDPEAWQLLWDFGVLQELEDDLFQSSSGLDQSWAGELLYELNRFCNLWRAEERSSWPAARAVLEPLLARANPERVHTVHAIGHAHLDTAWLWPLAETKRKAVRSWSSQLAYMERYPEYRFACSQAQQYAWIKDEQPELYERIRERAASGQWLPVGGTWIEPDCNLPSGESLVRQFLLGQRFFEREFGRRCAEFWNPDTFGYNAQLPQIMRGAGISRFLTQKLSWNRFNQPPHHSFTWQGLDGSEVLTHFPPSDTYNGSATVAELRAGARNYKDHDRSRHSLYLFGYGDGGGGPTPAMLERLSRVRDLQGVPRTRFSTSDEFFSDLGGDLSDPMTVVGELYFEFHRGTYTSQAAVKRGNRQGELLLHDAEFLSAVAARQGLLEYPRQGLERLWQLLLLNQFHDVLPGSSIGEVYVDAARDHAEVAAGAGALVDAAVSALSSRRQDDPARPLNCIGFARREVTRTPDGGLVLVSAPPYGVGEVIEPAGGVRIEEHAEAFVLDNGVLRAEIARDGRVRRLVHLSTGRDALSDAGNVLRIYDDHPTAWDAWDIDPFHLETGEDCPPAASCQLVQADALRAELSFERAIGSASHARQTVRLDAGSARLEIHTSIDWHESHRLLKACFPLAVHAHSATYQTQFGAVERPTHFSTSHDLARFEVPGHRFADLCEHGFGVALLTDSTYGYSCLGSDLCVSLLRAPKSPDPQADMGHHEFAYALMPHAGGWQDGGVVAEAARMGSPLRWATPNRPCSYAGTEDPNIVLDTIKLAEDSGALVLRLYEAHGARGRAVVRLDLPFSRARRCNLLEDPGKELRVSERTIDLAYRPWEIITLLID